MKRFLFFHKPRSRWSRLLYCAILLLLSSSVIEGQNAMYRNPVIPGFNPDPSICRVGEDFYLVTSSFEYFPGVPVYHSRDLVHWKMIGHVLERPSQLNLDSINCSGGIYAPTIRYHDGIFYMITTLVGAGHGNPGGNFIVTAKKPEGPWSDPHWIEDAPGIDPSLFFDEDGKAYYCGNKTPENKIWEKHRNIYVQEIDLKDWKLKGKSVDVLDGSEYYRKGTLDGGIESGVNNYESPHLYKKDGLYYLMIAHGGTSQNHAVSIWRSKNIFGPYEMNPANPILTHRDLSPEYALTSTGHADLIQTKKGDWWMVYLAKRPYGGENHILGRETCLSPVDWPVGKFPVVNPHGKTGRGELMHPRPELKNYPLEKAGSKDPFNDKKLQPQWTFIRTPRSQWWSLTERKGFLRIKLRPERISEQVNPSFIGRRLESPVCTVTAKLDFIPVSGAEEAGLVVERDKDYFFKFTIGLENQQKVLKLIQRSGNDTTETVIGKSLAGNNVKFLRVHSDGVLFQFSYSENGTDWKTLKDQVDGRLLGLAGAGRFTGTFVGLYASSNGLKSDNHADFDWFEYMDK